MSEEELDKLQERYSFNRYGMPVNEDELASMVDFDASAGEDLHELSCTGGCIVPALGLTQALDVTPSISIRGQEPRR